MTLCSQTQPVQRSTGRPSRASRWVPWQVTRGTRLAPSGACPMFASNLLSPSMARPTSRSPPTASCSTVAAELLARAPLAAGHVAFDVDPTLLQRARLFALAPADAGLPAAPSLEALRRVGAYEPPMTSTPDIKRYELKPLLPRSGSGGCCVAAWSRAPSFAGHDWSAHAGPPVCHARVHICEAHSWPRLIAKIPDLQLLRVREELLRPRPEPGPDPPDCAGVAPLAAAPRDQRPRGRGGGAADGCARPDAGAARGDGPGSP